MNNNILTNSFVGGLNLDIDITSIPENQYRYAENIRIITDKNGTSGVLLNILSNTPIEGGNFLSAAEKIIGVDTVDKYIIIITAQSDGICRIYRVWDWDNPPIKTLVVFKGLIGYSTKSRVLMVTNLESSTNIKLYMTDGNSSIKNINLMDNRYVHVPGTNNPLLDREGNVINTSSLDMVPSSLLNQPSIVTLGSGSLKSGKVQYSYQLFNARGSYTLTSTPSKLIHLASSSTNSELNIYKGDPKDTGTGKSVKFTISLLDNNGNNVVGSLWDRCRIYRIFYNDTSEDPIISILDEVSVVGAGTEISYEDTGIKELSVITLSEYNAVNNGTFAPSTIEKKNNILFAAGIKESTWDIEFDARAYRCTKKGRLILNSSNTQLSVDVNITPATADAIYKSIPELHDCINPYNSIKDQPDEINNDCLYIENTNIKGGKGLNITYRFVELQLLLDDVNYNHEEYCKIFVLPEVISLFNFKKLGSTETALIVKLPEAISKEKRLRNYADPYIAANYTGYQRDEIYRFGIVFYDRSNNKTPVHWIGDIRMPHAHENPAFDVNEELHGNALGLEFDVRNIPDSCVSYEIVRCKRETLDRTVVMQAAMSDIVHFPYKYYGADDLKNGNGYRPVVPLGYTGHDRNTIGASLNIFNDDMAVDRWGSIPIGKVTKYYNAFVSPEIDILGDKSVELLSDSYVDANYFLKSKFKTRTRYSGNKPKEILNREFICPKDVITSPGDSGLQRMKADQAVMGGIVYSNAINNTEFNLIAVLSKPGTKMLEQILTLVAKHYIPHLTSLPTRRNIEINNPTYARELQANEITIPNSVGLALGSDIFYTNIGQLTADKEYEGHFVLKSGYFGPCVVAGSVGNSFDSKIPRIGSIDTNTAFCDEGRKRLMREYPTSKYDIAVVNIKRNIIPYGGNNFNSRTNSIYISTGSYFLNKDQSIKSIVYGGDTYLGVHDHKTVSPFPYPGTGDFKNYKEAQMSIADYIPFETTVNLALQYGETTSRSASGVDDWFNPFLTSYAQGLLGNQLTKLYYMYNDAYSTQSGARKYVSKGTYDLSDINNINRIVYSETKTNNEISDSWLKFKFANYLDVDNQYGPITNLVQFNDKLFFFQDSALGIVAVNDRSLITDNNVNALTLGTGDILSRYDYVTNTNGSSIVNDPSIVKTGNSMYWYDKDKNEVCSFSDTIHKLSKEKNVQTFLNKGGKAVHDALYDTKYNEVLMCFEDKVLVYNEYTQCFSSFYTYNPDQHASFSDKLLYIKDNEITLSANFPLNTMTSRIQVVVNKDILQTKVFDNVYFGGTFSNIRLMLLDGVTFSTKSQEGTISEDYLEGGYSIDYREDTYRFAIGRELQVEDTMSFPGRLRGKYLICDYIINCDNQRTFNLPNINTTYRYSLV